MLIGLCNRWLDQRRNDAPFARSRAGRNKRKVTPAAPSNMPMAKKQSEPALSLASDQNRRRRSNWLGFGPVNLRHQ
jgi:hypothetical protein